MGFLKKVFKAVTSPFRAVEKHVLRPIIHHPGRAIATTAGFMLGGPIGAGAASAGYSYIKKGRPLGESITQGIYTGAGAYVGGKAGDWFSKVNQSGGSIVAHGAAEAARYSAGDVARRAVSGGLAQQGVSKIFGQTAGSAVGHGVMHVLNNSGMIGAGIGGYMFDSAKGKAMKRAQQISQEQESIDKAYQSQTKQMDQQQRDFDEQIRANQHHERRARSRTMRPKRNGIMFSDYGAWN